LAEPAGAAMKINEINWGDDSAEKDASLLAYFVASDAFKRLSQKTKHLVIGRKGSGKSALLAKLHEVFSKEDRTFVVKVTPKFNAIRTLLNDKTLTNDFGAEIFFQHTWVRQMLLDVLCAVGQDERGLFSSGSFEFAREITKQQGRTGKDFVENVVDVLSKIKVKAGNLGELGLHLEKELRDVANVESLEHHLLEILKDGARVVVLVDDLDLGWDNSPTANNLLLGLLTAANYLVGISKSIHPIIFLREDVYSILVTRTQHADKFRNVERIRWDKDKLIEVLSARINFNRVQRGEKPVERPFASVFPATIGTANSDNWLVERTLSRPRELIQLSRYYAESVDGDQPSDTKLKEAEPNYSNWKLDDLCAEYSNQYPGLVAIMSFWKTKYFRHKYHLKKQELEEMLLSVASGVNLNEPWFNEIVETTDLKRFMDVLYEIGFIGDFVLGGQGGSRTYYSYEERHEPKFDEVQIHPCFRRAVNTVERIREPT
jgi:energy-coupling factor transporter ATP-binding protein EcfA2